MKIVRLAVGLCLIVTLTAACGSSGDEPGAGTAGAGGSGGSTSNGGGAGKQENAGTAGSQAGTAQGGQNAAAGSGGSSDGGSKAGSGSGGGGAGSGGSGGSADQINCIASSSGCLCSNVPKQPNDAPTCTAVSVKGHCCKNAAAGTCSCRSWSCEKDSLGCTCGSGTDGPLTKCTGTFSVCCLSVIGTASNCYCDDTLTQCVEASDKKVPSCGVDIAPCADGEEPVDACKQ